MPNYIGYTTVNQAEIARIATQTNFNGNGVFTTTGVNGSLSVYVGDLTGASSIAVTINTITVSGNTVTSIGSGNTNISGVSLATQSDAASALTTIKEAINGVSNDRASIGAGMNRLQSAVAVLQTQSQNTLAAESNIRDANMALEVSNLTKFQILAQSGIAALAQG